MGGLLAEIPSLFLCLGHTNWQNEACLMIFLFTAIFDQNLSLSLVYETLVVLIFVELGGINDSDCNFSHFFRPELFKVGM